MKNIIEAAKDHSKFTNKLKNLAQSDNIYVKETNRVPGVSLDIYKKVMQSSKLAYTLLSNASSNCSHPDMRDVCYQGLFGLVAGATQDHDRVFRN